MTIGKAFAVVTVLLLSGCNALSSVGGALLGRGVNANVQAGAENRQAIVSVERQAPSVSIRPRANVERIQQEQNEVRADNINQVVTGLPWWVWVLLGMLIPGPSEWVKDWMLSRRK